MMSRKWLTWLIAVSVTVLFVVTALNAGTNVDDVITMDYNNYTKWTKAPPKFEYVQFTHKKHADDYNISCGDCHHDGEGKPLDLKWGDSVQKCAECHNIMEKTKENAKDIMVLENAMHDNCITCHKEINVKDGDPKGMKGPAPASCNNCHVPIKS